ncbi:MAG: hypothetical protein WD824_10400 [Cyclobacteriaceae bacterium]
MHNFIKSFVFLLMYAMIPLHAIGQDSVYTIKVHFLYGSKPKKEFKDSERKWFGGKLGGHVGIEYEPDQTVDFVRRGEFHWFAKKNNPHSRFALRSTTAFWGIFGSPAGSVKKASVIIPITRREKIKLDSLVKTYSAQTPYDYAFFGMRCGSATYDILSQLGVLTPYSYRKTYRKIFYPKKLRKRLFAKAGINKWKIDAEGTSTRKWERD